MALQFKWKVQEAPTGPYRAFQRRGWPTCYYRATDKPAALITCEDDYTPGRARGEVKHRELVVSIADHSCRTTDGRPTFVWRKLKARFATLAEAKVGAERFIQDHPEFQPQEGA